MRLLRNPGRRAQRRLLLERLTIRAVAERIDSKRKKVSPLTG
jgi:hypothetical protein